MKYLIQCWSMVLLLCLGATALWAQPGPIQLQRTKTYAVEAAKQYQAQQAKLAKEAKRLSIPMTKMDGKSVLHLVDITNGHPTYEGNFNTDSQRTASADQVKFGGNLNLNLTGAGIHVGVWEAFEDQEEDGILEANVRNTHDEFDGRVTIREASGFSDHATHVAGTIIAAGVNTAAEGFANAATVDSYDAANDMSELANAAGEADPLVVSNHSYGARVGYDNDGIYTGPAGTTEDPRFGAYTSRTRDWDETAYNTPFVLVVKSAGNDRNDGPSPLDVSGAEPDGGADGFDCLPPGGVAKNIITVAAANQLIGNYAGPLEPSLAGFSSFGPTDDGRVKPDIAAQGDWLLSSGKDADDDYVFKGGTSMAAPSVSGGAALLYEHWDNVIGGTPSAVTMKGLLLHTADEAGNAIGPDYRFGWGMMNVADAATLISVDDYEGCSHYIEGSIGDGGKQDYTITSSGDSPLKVTLVWHDPAADNTNDDNTLNPNTSYLVNDLDMQLRHTSTNTVFFPFQLDPNNPGNAATTGVNSRDNVEQIVIVQPEAGPYTISISAPATIEDGPQGFTLWIMGNDASDDHLNVSGINIGDTRTYAANQTITIGPAVNVLPSADVENYAGDFIRVRPGTHVQSGSRFLARIAPGGGCGGFSSDMKRDNYPGILPLAEMSDQSEEDFLEERVTEAIATETPPASIAMTLAPNPAERLTTVTYALDRPAEVRLQLLSPLGQMAQAER
ncbi:MAG: S8 family serine peptidase, partial [Bacteroidota bacterium]